MKAKIFLIPLMSVALVACESHSTPTPPSSQNRTMNTTLPSNRTNSTSTFSDSNRDVNVPSNRTFSDRMDTDPDTMFIEIKEADNTGRNVRDRQSGSLTSFDQSENEQDRTITVNIRKALIGEPSLSTNAKNIKVITINGTVTLRGPVNTPQEKAMIEQLLTRIEGIQQVDNQLEVLHQANR